MLRVVLIVLLTGALLGVTMPLVETARVDHGEAQVTSELGRLETAAQTLAAQNDPVPGNHSGARRTFTLTLPARTWSTAGLTLLRWERAPNRSRLQWGVAGGSGHTQQLADGLVVGPPGGLELRAGGRHRLVLSLTARDGDPAVVVHRPKPSGGGGGASHG